MKAAVLALAILLGVAADAAATTITYSINMFGTLNGSPVTNVIILERNGASTSIDTSPSFILNATGLSTLTHDVSFTPSETLILGLDASAIPGGQTHVMLLTDPAFGWSVVGMRFRDVFNIGYVDFRNAVLGASNGDAAQQAFLLNFFANGTGAAAAFNSTFRASGSVSAAVAFGAAAPSIMLSPTTRFRFGKPGSLRYHNHSCSIAT